MISIHAPRTGSDRSAVTAAHRWSAFQSTLPARGATIRPVLRCFPKPISIHAPRTGSDKIVFDAATQRTHFNPRSPHGERRVLAPDTTFHMNHFNPRSPHGERRPPSARASSPKRFQSTLPARGATATRGLASTSASHFNPRSPHGERHAVSPEGNLMILFQSTLPARGATL